MTKTAVDLAEATRLLRSVAAEFVGAYGARLATDAELVAVAIEAGAALRGAEAVLIEVAGEVEGRSESAVRDERFAVRHGCHNTNEFLQRATGVAPATAGRWLRASRGLHGRTCMTTGATLEPSLPGLRQALAASAIGVDGLLAAADPLLDAEPRAILANFAAADAAVGAVALESNPAFGEAIRGDAPDPDAGDEASDDTFPDDDTNDGSGNGNGNGPSNVLMVPISVAELKIHATAWACALDQDGAEPLEDRALRKRGVSLGAPQDGLVRLNGWLLPEVASVMQRIFDAIDTPRRVRFVESDPDAAPVDKDTRTPQQRRHDAFATALNVAAASETLPTVGGAAPTLVVHVSEHDLVTGRGWAGVDGTMVSVAVARHAGCSGSLQRVTTNSSGRITSIGTEERLFNRHQRRAIALRDGGCVIPGCTVGAAWCEVHHVTEHARGGATHTDNGVLLCWNHHRFLDKNGWSVRMNTGVPEVRAPRWIDREQVWRRPHPPPSFRTEVRRT